MAITPFTKDELPTMEAFNVKLRAIFVAAESKAKIEVGTYVGTGTESADILIGFTPKAVLITYLSSFYTIDDCTSAFILPGLPNEANVKRAEIIDGGFRVYCYLSNQISYSSYLNYSGRTHRYIAIG